MKAIFTPVLLGLLLAGYQEPAQASQDRSGSAATQAQASAEAAAEAPSTFSDTALGVTFSYPAGLTPRPCGGERSDCVGLFEAEAEEPVVTVQAFAGDLDTVGQEQAGFERNDEGVLMTTYGRFQPQEVQDFSGASWQGRRATIVCGVSDEETGFHAAGGECLWAVASNGQRSIMVTSDGLSVGLQASEMVLSSLRLTR